MYALKGEFRMLIVLALAKKKGRVDKKKKKGKKDVGR